MMEVDPEYFEGSIDNIKSALLLHYELLERYEEEDLEDPLQSTRDNV